MALLSAAHVSGVAQLEGILAALATPEARELGVSLTVISAEPAVLAKAKASKVEGIATQQMKTDAPASPSRSPQLSRTSCTCSATAG